MTQVNHKAITILSIGAVVCKQTLGSLKADEMSDVLGDAYKFNDRVLIVDNANQYPHRR